MNKLLLAIPFGYFIKTRLNNKAAVLFHGFAEFLLGWCLLVYSGMSMLMALESFILCYLAFISIYEIGYIFNDFVSVRFEKNPRKRLDAWRPSNALIVLWIGIRVIVFFLLSYYLQVLQEDAWIWFYFILILVYALHNSLPKKEYKIFSFVSLAFMRFYAPLFIFWPKEFMLLTLPAVFIHYVFFRTITYIDSKGLLHLPGRNSLGFKANYYLLFIPLSLLLSVLSFNWLCLWINLYFLIFWGGLLMVSRIGLIRLGDLKTD